MNNFKKGTEAWYEKAYSEMTFDKKYVSSVFKSADRVLGGKVRYLAIERAIGMPWYFVGAIHNMEATCNFSGVLHNGERIIGTDKKTKLVPKGKGPFATWEDSAVDALQRFKRFGGAWTLGLMLQKAEEFNGVGVLKNHPGENTPYLWAQTSINDDTGKYVRDGHWDEKADANGQTGVAAIFKRLEAVGEIKIPREFS